jgi:signal recognition particle subunit SRP54
MSGDFNLEDFLKQMQQIKRLGPIGKLLDMVPGMNKLSQDVDMSDAEHELKRVEAIIQSMTVQERQRPKIIKASRKRRIAAGSGTTVQDVNVLLKQFKEMQRMMKQIGKGGRRSPGGLGALLGKGLK